MAWWSDLFFIKQRQRLICVFINGIWKKKRKRLLTKNLAVFSQSVKGIGDVKFLSLLESFSAYPLPDKAWGWMGKSVSLVKSGKKAFCCSVFGRRMVIMSFGELKIIFFCYTNVLQKGNRKQRSTSPRGLLCLGAWVKITEFSVDNKSNTFCLLLVWS